MLTYKYISLVSFFALSASNLPAAKVTVDPAVPNSILLEDFSSEGDSADQLLNGVSFKSSSEGIATYSIAAVKDPTLIFRGYVEPIDFQAYPNIRIRHGFSGISSQVEQGSLFPLPVKVGRYAKHDINEALVVRQTKFENGPLSATGLRLDPVDGDPVTGDYRIDYIILDRGPTLGFEFDERNSSRGGVNNFFRGFNLGGEDGKEIRSGIDEGVFGGLPNGNDPMMLLQLKQATGIGSIDTTIYQFIEIRMRLLMPGGGEATVFFENLSGGFSDNKIVFDLAEDEFFHTYLIDLRENPAWKAGPVHNFRFDPVKGKQAFQIDHIRFYHTARGE